MSETTSQETQNRRNDDQDRRLNERLERLEKQQERTQSSVVALETTVNLVKSEQGHMRETVELRLRMIEDAGKLHTAKLDDLRTLMATMMDSADKSPAGREIVAKMRDIEKDCQKIGELEQKCSELERWRNRAEGSISVFWWLGFSGVAALGIMLLRVLKVLP